MQYRSRASVLGLPLIHVSTAEMVDGRVRRGVARGWIAIGDIAFGVISIGAIAFGGLSLGGLGVGVISLGGASLGGYAIGGLAIGFLAMGGLAIGWECALGGAAFAKDYAIGGYAVAEHAHDAAAQEYVRTSRVRFGRAFMQHSRWLLILILLPVFLAWWNRRKGTEPPTYPPPA